ncbi:MAG: hypothetical protein HDR00_02530 [Lachnospiraceae bacterium]|nr:hypothetical protein [Lachnospiraceae bacterium]
MEMEYMVNESNLLEVKADGKKEVYDLSKPIKETSLVVQNEKRNILHRMDLPTVIANVDNAVDLLDVSYHAVYGFPVQSRLYGLQKQLMDLNDTGIVVITGFKRKATQAITELASMYKWLLKGAEVVAMGKLDAFSEMAADMAEQADKMAVGYQRLADVTSSVLQDVIQENAKQYEKSDHLKQMMAECEAEESNAAALRESLEKRIKSLNREYSRMVKQEEAAERHKNTMEIMGAVFGFLGKAIDVAGSAVAGQGGTVSNQGMSNDGIKGQEKEVKEKKEKIEGELEKAKEEKAALQKELDEKIRQKDETEKTEEKEELEKAISDCRENIRKKGEEIDQLERDKKSAESMLGKIGSLLSNTGSQMTREVQESASADVARAERMNEIYDEMLRLEEENTKQVGLLAKYAKQMESFVVDQKSIDAAIQALIIATSSLKRAVVAFKDIALFWNSLEESCRALSESTFKNTIKGLQELPKEDRIEYYKDVDIMYPLLCYIAQWTAVASVSADYLDAAEKTRNHLNETLVTADSTDMTRQQHWDKASSLAGKVGDRLQEQVTEGEQKIKNLTEKKTAK